MLFLLYYPNIKAKATALPFVATLLEFSVMFPVTDKACAIATF
jgi:hypothetical protein